MSTHIYRPSYLLFWSILLSGLALGVTATNLSARSSCIINSYTDASNLLGCSIITIAAQTVPGGQSLALTGLADGTTVELAGDITFGTGTDWSGNLFSLSGGSITFNGNGYTIEGNGAYYWDGKGTGGGRSKPRYTVALQISGFFTNLVVKNVPGHAFSVKNPSYLTITGVTFDNSNATVLATNTDGFDISSSTNLTITGNTVINQDDCIAINDAKNVVFSNNSCTGGHGISIGSIKTGNIVDNVTITGNQVIRNQNGLRIKTYVNHTRASVSNVVYKDNTVINATEYGVLIIQDYTTEGESGTPTPGISITNVSFVGMNTVSTLPNGVMAKVLCYTGECTGIWDWTGLTTKGGLRGNNIGGAPIIGYAF